MSASIAPKLEVTTLQTFNHEKLSVIPSQSIFLKESCKRTLTCPLNTYPFQSLHFTVYACDHLVLNRKLAVYIIFNLLNGRVSTLIRILNTCLRNRHLEPVRHFENIPLFQLLVHLEDYEVLIAFLGMLINRFRVLPVENILVAQCQLRTLLSFHFKIQ